MRISKGAARAATATVLTALAGGLCIALGFGPGPGPGSGRGHVLSLQPALAFDGTATPSTASLTPRSGLRATEGAPPLGLTAKQFSALQYAADQGRPSAQWKLARMYAKGDGVPRDDLRAFDYFSQIANSHADETPGTRQALMVADAFVALGRYTLKGIPHSAVKPDPDRARAMFAYAASYFGDADAQYELGRLYLDGKPSDQHEAARWLLLAANKGHCRAQVVLGDLLFRGRVVPRQAARGLMWLTLGRDCAGTDEGWVKPLYDRDIRRATDAERALALVDLRDWINGRRY